MPDENEPYVGQVVYYHAPGDGGLLAAIVTCLDPVGRPNLTVFSPVSDATLYAESVQPHSPDNAPGSASWSPIGQ